MVRSIQTTVSVLVGYLVLLMGIVILIPPVWAEPLSHDPLESPTPVNVSQDLDQNTDIPSAPESLSPINDDSGGDSDQQPPPIDNPASPSDPIISPVDGSTVGVATPIVMDFASPVDQLATEQSIHITTIPMVPGRFYWMSPTQLRWLPWQFWPANTTVIVDAGASHASFHIGDTLMAIADDATHQMSITRNGIPEKVFPISMGMAAGGHQTPNGIYYVLDKNPTIIMDSSTYGVPVNSAWGYRVPVQDAVRIDNTGIFVHSAPWSIAAQGKRDTSHGCINLSPENAKWFFDHFGPGDPVIVKNSVGMHSHDGSDDWNQQALLPIG